MNAPLYTTEILRLAASLSQPHALEREAGHSELRSPTCGSTISIAVGLDSEGKVAEISQIVHACAFGQASASLLESGTIGRSRDEVDAALKQLDAWLGGDDAVPAWPGITALLPARSRKARHGAILLPFRALVAAIEAAGRG